MSDQESRPEHPSRTSRRQVVATGAKLAYGTPLVAASFALTGEGALATSCACPSGTYAIPAHVIAWLKAWWPDLARKLEGKCVGCKTGALNMSAGWSNVSFNVGKKFKRACPGEHNYITLYDPACVSG